MDPQKISVEQLIVIIQKSDLDKTIKDILIRDVQNEGVNEFLLEQVIGYCDNAISQIDQLIEKQKMQNPPI